MFKNTTTLKANLQSVQRHINAQRARVEKARTTTFQRMVVDVHTIVKNEIKYTRELIDALSPVKVTIDPVVLTDMCEKFPIKIEFKPHNVDDDKDDDIILEESESESESSNSTRETLS